MDQNNSPFADGQEVDFVALALKIWAKKRFILSICAIGAFIGLIVAFSIPKEYTTTVKLSPESTQRGGGSNQLGGLAAMAGINLGTSSGADALSVDLYPDIVASTPFLLELVDVPVKTVKGDLNTSLFEYINRHQRSAWWNYLTKAPFQLAGWGMSLFKKEKKTESADLTINPFHLTPKQEQFVSSLKEKIMVSINQKTGVIVTSVQMQDPLISAMVMDSVLVKLQTYVTDYRTRKARYDLAFAQKLFADAQDAYYKAQQTYARYIDGNKNVVSASFRTEEERLRNEMNLTYSIYNQMAQQLEASKVKVQEVTPVYTVIEPAKVALWAEKPNKMMILVGFTFMAAIASVGWIFGKNIVETFKNNK